MVYKTQYSSPIGLLLLASDGDALIGLWMEGQKYFSGTVKEEMVENDDLEVFEKTKTWLDNYFSGNNPKISDLPLAPRGEGFRTTVWQLLCEIPYGRLTTYGELAKEVAKRMNRETMSAQAVGGAVGHNPISIIIPCHRVVGSNNSLTGYAGGLEKKIKLLELEGIDVSKLQIPKKGTAL